jgi:hypothetical protein
MLTAFPSESAITFGGIPSVRLVRRLGKLSAVTSSEVLAVLGETFSE